jgi:hypothetical protein
MHAWRLAVGGWRLVFLDRAPNFSVPVPEGRDESSPVRSAGKREEGDAVPTGTIEMSLFFSLSPLRGNPKLFINLGQGPSWTAPTANR